MPINCNLTEYCNTSNDIYLDALSIRDRYLVMFGGAGSGKSEEVARRWLLRILVGMKKGIRHKLLALRKTQPAIRRSVFSLFNKYIDLWNLKDIVHINRKDMTFTFSNGSVILCCGMDDPEKIKSIEGLTGAWMEEATEFSEDDFRELDRRIRGLSGTFLQIVITFNPIEVKWIQEEFFNFTEKEDGSGLFDVSEKVTDRYRRFKKVSNVKGKLFEVHGTSLLTTYEDNRFLDDLYKVILEDLKHKDITAYRIYALGRWGSPKGLVYKEGLNWDVCTDWPSPESFEKHAYGLDFGYSNAPTGIIEMGMIGNEIWERERLYELKLTNQDIARKFVKLGITRRNKVVADCAEPKSIEEIRRAGFKMTECRKGPDSIRNGISLVKDFKVHVYGDSENLIKEKRNYRWMEKDGEFLNEPVDTWNHLLDGERYVMDNWLSHKSATFSFNLGNRYPA
ncbi:PBSX family phage terminase large subunit [Candidatus Pacearchaeota archaeon]|nr:PBSX family phage terminase large subunit [Candidatus Pacearchaeota archaeon]